MCGIVGAVGSWAADLDRVRVEAGMDRLTSRGPDAAGIRREPGVVLGHRRLAIIDVSSAANQPMTSPCGRYSIVFNGEIYNYRELRESLPARSGWRTDSDTETVLEAFAAWGPSCLSRFHGMFALAIWDREKESLILARDRLGVKPLYYTSDARRVAFASRPGALREMLPGVSWKVDRQAVRYYLEAGYIPAPYAFFEDVRKVEPGHFVIVDAAGVRATKYWSLDSTSTDTSSSRTEDELLEELGFLIRRSVQWRMVSSVPVGAFLSGGIDSSLVVAQMMELAHSKVKTFTIGFSEKDFDESKDARAIAEHLGSDHHSQQLTPASLLELLPKFLEEFDEPFSDYSALPVMAVSRLASSELKVVLSGDGGDEAFGGYHYYRVAALLERAYRLPSAARRSMSAVLRLLGGRLGLMGLALDRPSSVAAFAFARSVIKDRTSIMSSALRLGTHSLQELYEDRAKRFAKNLSAVEVAMRLDLAFTLPDDYLQKVDVGSMAFSVEAREPLLDHSVLEWAAALPTHWKVRGAENKYLLRRLAYRHVPRQLLDRPKRGFGVPMGAWLRAELAGWVRGILGEVEIMEALELDRSAILDLWNAHQGGRTNAGSTLWGVLMLVAFFRSNVSRLAC